MKKLTALTILMGMIIACNPLAFYPRLDWIITWYIDDYISLDHKQSQWVDSRLSHRLDWHCQTQLPQYAEFLRSIRRDVETGDQRLTVARLELHLERLDRYWDALLTQIGPDIVDMLVSASDAQITDLFENLEKNNRDKEIRFVEPSPPETALIRQKRMQKRLTYWLSDLTEPQQLAIAEWSRGLEPIAAEWIAHRRKLQDEVRTLLAQKNKGIEINDKLLELIVNYRRLRTDSYQQKIDVNTNLTLHLLAELLQTLTSAQKIHFSNRLESWAEDIDQLSCPPVMKTKQFMTPPTGSPLDG